MKKTLFSLLFLTSSAFSFPRFLPGTYQLSGSDSRWDGNVYQGEVTILPQGENFSVVWRIDSVQTKVGIGILYKDTFCVSFRDIQKGTLGIATYRLISDGELEGRWTTYESKSQKPEYLVWKGR